MKIGVYVGSFNPVHIGHINNIKYLLDNYLNKVYVVPTMNYWNKNDLIDIKYRIEMLKYYESDNIIIDSSNNNLEYTYQVLDYYSKIYNIEDIYLIIGADNIIDFNKWKNIEELLKYNVIVLGRNNIDIKYYINKYRLNENKFKIVIFNNIDISSTTIRNDIDNNKEYLGSKVYKYIKDNNLYRR